MTNIIISYWTGRPPNRLYQLLNQIARYDAQAPFIITIVCNGGDERPLKLPEKYAKTGIRVLNRENSGYNIGAWEHGWRSDHGSDHFLFIQDECRILKEGWLKAFLDKFKGSKDIGLLGESINWKCAWLEQRNNPIAASCLNREGETPFNAIDFLMEFLVHNGIDPGESAEHLQSLVLFSSRAILEEISGFITSDIYAEAVGTEIAISKKIQERGYRIDQVAAQPFSYIGHLQWSVTWYRSWIKFKLFARPYKAKVEKIFKRAFN